MGARNGFGEPPNTAGQQPALPIPKESFRLRLLLAGLALSLAGGVGRADPAGTNFLDADDFLAITKTNYVTNRVSITNHVLITNRVNLTNFVTVTNYVTVTNFANNPNPRSRPGSKPNSTAVAKAGPRTNSPPNSETNSPPLHIAYLTPAEEAKTFICEDGYSLEPVVTDPVIKEPVLTVFDGNGRMFVAEMRSYMNDLNGTDQRKKNGRVSVHWSSKHDGVYDRHAVFADNLVLPRMVMPLGNGVLINETDSDDIYLYTDTKGDGVADKKVMFHAGGTRGGNIEHQPGGMLWDIDNWIYFAMNAYRLRVSGTNVISDPVPSNGDQWGLAQDDYGKLWGMNAGMEAGPVNFEAPTRYGLTYFDEQSPPEYYVVWPLIGLGDAEGGDKRIRPVEKSLNHFTATCGSDIYRGSRLPRDLYGNHLFCEPVGRLIRRTRVEVKDGFTTLHNYYEEKHSEFIRSTDPNFRPVNITDGPDGAVYITDMYRGLIQERDWVGEGTYLRGVVKKYNLDQNFGRGRIWRLVHNPFKPLPPPKLLEASPDQLVNHLADPDGWWRDNAQELIVLKQDKSVVSKLINMARSGTNPLAQIHAIWTLEGLDSLTPDFIREELKDPDPEVRVAAVRSSETLYLKGDHSLVTNISALAKDPDPRVVIQVLLTASLLKWPESQELINRTVSASTADGVKRIGGKLVNAVPNPSAPAIVNTPKHTDAENKVLSAGETIYRQLCFVCHGMDGKGTPFQTSEPGTTMAPPFRGSQTVAGYPDAFISVVLKGLNGPVAGKNYDAQMVPMESNDDAWVAAVLSYIRNNFGNHSTFITEADVARVRAEIKNHAAPWTLKELHELTPQYLTNRQDWKLTSSLNSSSLHAAIDGKPSTVFDTRAPQAPGQWVQIELPEVTEVAGVELDAGASEGNYPRGYQVQLSGDGTNWGKPVAEGNSSAAKNQIIFKPTDTKFVRITLTAADATSWAIAELQVMSRIPLEELLRTPDFVTVAEATPEPLPGLRLPLPSQLPTIPPAPPMPGPLTNFVAPRLRHLRANQRPGEQPPMPGLPAPPAPASVDSAAAEPPAAPEMPPMPAPPTNFIAPALRRRLHPPVPPPGDQPAAADTPAVPAASNNIQPQHDANSSGNGD